MKPGLAVDLFVLVAVSFITIYFIAKSHDKKYYLRNIAGLEAIEEAVGRATEMDKIVHFIPGITGLNNSRSAVTFSGLEVLNYVSRTVANYGAKLLVTIRNVMVLPVAQEVVRNAYSSIGKINSFDYNSVQFLTDNQFAYATAVRSILQEGQVAANIMVGSFFAESLMITEAGHHAGAIQIAGTTSVTQLPFFITTCDYVLIGEEVYAAGAILADDPHKIGSIVGQDFSKLLVIAILIVGAIISASGIIN